MTPLPLPAWWLAAHRSWCSLPARGTPTGNPLAPVIKITGNKLTYANMVDNIDVDASPIIYGTKTLEGLGDELLKLTQEVACGKQTKAESLGYTEMAIARVCNFV